MNQPVIKVIKANPYNLRNNALSLDEGLKVAAYARVSTDFDEQEDSFERQVDYYTRYISSNPKWKFVKVYSDPGVSGTRAEKRPGFQEMIKDCKEGKINKILVKSIARFARNTVDALRYIRELKEIGVSIFFEAQNIDTGTPGGDVLLTILAATAEEESRTISKNIKWSYQKKFQKGEMQFSFHNFLGYRKDSDGNIIIIEEEAKIVRRIYNEFLFGYSISQITNRLNEDKIPTPSGKDKWGYSVVRSILTNEKYYGCAWMGKTFKPDVLSKKRYKNEGQVESYVVENAFPSIIDKQKFEMVQLEINKLSSRTMSGDKTQGKFSSKYCFSKMIRCGCCGAFYTRCNNMRLNGKKIQSWWCSNRRKKDYLCNQKGISEEEIQNAFVKVLNDLIGNYEDVKSVLEMTISSVIMDDPTDKIERIDSRIDILQLQMLELHKKKTNGLISETDYGRQGGAIAEKIELAKKERESLESAFITSTSAKRRVNEILKVLDSIDPLTNFDSEIFIRLVESVVITERTKIKFKFKVGIEREVVANVK